MAALSFARKVPAIPAADVASLRTAWVRTTIVRLVLAALLVLAVAAAFVTARTLEPAKAAFLPKGTSGVIVLDVSLSVTDPVFKRIHNAIKMLADGGDGVGVVAFSDVAYELLPPGSPPEELRPMLRYFKGRPLQPGQAAFDVTYPRNPWSAGFSAGTKISAGLEAAMDVLEREEIEKGSILLVSDLDTAPSDESALSQVVGSIKAEGVPLRVVPLFPTAQDRAFFERILGEENLVTPPQLAARNRSEADTSLLGANPALLALLAGFVLFLLTVNEWWGARVEVPRRPA